MGKAQWFTVIILLILFISSVSAQESSEQQVCQAGMTASDKAYFDGLNQKTIAQMGAKMDANMNAVERSLKEEVNRARDQIKQEVVTEMKGALKSIVIGLGGVIIVVLAVFRLLEYRLQHTKRIKKYEDELNKKTKEFDDNLKKMQEQMKENEILKSEMMIYKQSIDKYAVSLGIQPQTSLKQVKPTLPPPTKKKYSKKRKIFHFILIALIILVAGYLIYINFLSGARLN